MEINTKKVNIDDLQPNKWNPKLSKEDDTDVAQQYQEVIKSIKTYGLIDPIMVRSLKNDGEKPYEIINGYHRFMACKELGFTEVVINDLGGLGEQEAKKLTIITEEIKIPLDELKLSSLLKEMLNSEDLDSLADGLPYSKELIASKIELLDFNCPNSNESNLDEEIEIKDTELSKEMVSMSLLFDTEEQRKKATNFFEHLMQKYKTKNFAEALTLFIKENNYA